MWERGNSVVVLIRRTPGGRFALIAFLVDVFCLGVKEVLFNRYDAPEIEAFIEAMDMTAPLRPVDPPHARKLLRDLVAWSRSLGIEPHADYAAGDLGNQFAVDDRHAVDGLEQLSAAFAGHNDLVGGAKRFAAKPGVDQAVVGNTELDVALDESIEDGIGNLIGHFVRMSFGYRLAGEQVV